MRKTLLILAALTLVSTSAFAKVKANTETRNGHAVNGRAANARGGNGTKANGTKANGIDEAATGVTTHQAQAANGRLIVR